MNNLILVTIGDIDGIGIKLLLQEWEKNKINNFLILTNISILKKKKIINNNKLNVIKKNFINESYDKKKINIYSFKTKNKYTNTLDSLEISYKLTLKYKFMGILTLPLNKKLVNLHADKKFIDQTTLFSNFENVKDSNMTFIHKNKFFIPLTTHIELKKVSRIFKNKKLITNKILSINNTLKNDFKIKSPLIALAGINPHAGELGLISHDEKKYLAPIINQIKKKGINIHGPFSGDGLINKQNLLKYDVFLFTYHDQALIPFKIISDFEGINFTSNLKIIRVSPSHGTATNLSNNYNLNSKGITNCFKIIRKVSKNRKTFDNS